MSTDALFQARKKRVSEPLGIMVLNLKETDPYLTILDMEGSLEVPRSLYLYPTEKECCSFL